MGEALVKMEFFFFLVVVLQRFHLEKESPDAPLISEECVKYVVHLMTFIFHHKKIKNYQTTLSSFTFLLCLCQVT